MLRALKRKVDAAVKKLKKGEDMRVKVQQVHKGSLRELNDEQPELDATRTKVIKGKVCKEYDPANELAYMTGEGEDNRFLIEAWEE